MLLVPCTAIAGHVKEPIVSIKLGVTGLQPVSVAH